MPNFSLNDRTKPAKIAGPDVLTLEPLALPLAKAVAVTGLSRSTIYRCAAEGRIVLLKAGRTTLVDMASARAFLAGLPRAVVGAAREA